jgi:hypothetical protein
MLSSSLSKEQYLLKLDSLIMMMEILFYSSLSETQVLVLKKRISLKYLKCSANWMRPQVLTPLESGWDYPLVKRLQRLSMEKYSSLTMNKKFRSRLSFIQIGLRYTLKKIILMINPNIIVQLIIIKKANK